MAYENKLRELKAAFLEDIAVQTGITVVRMVDVVQNIGRCGLHRVVVIIFMDMQCSGIDRPE